MSTDGLPIWKRRGALLAAVLVLAAVPCARAADDNTIITPGAARADAPGKAATAGMGSITLILGVALAGAGGWMVWRNRRGTPVARDVRNLAIDETRSLGNRQFLVVASYDGRKFLLGVCPGRIEMLTPLETTRTTEKAPQ
jgi:flagellar protein FliO/FliZ